MRGGASSTRAANRYAPRSNPLSTNALMWGEGAERPETRLRLTHFTT